MAQYVESFVMPTRVPNELVDSIDLTVQTGVVVSTGTFTQYDITAWVPLCGSFHQWSHCFYAFCFRVIGCVIDTGCWYDNVAGAVTDHVSDTGLDLLGSMTRVGKSRGIKFWAMHQWSQATNQWAADYSHMPWYLVICPEVMALFIWDTFLWCSLLPVMLREVILIGCNLGVPWPLRKWRQNLWEAKIQNGHPWPYWKCNLKTKWYPKLCNTTFPTNFDMENPFLALFLYFN